MVIHSLHPHCITCQRHRYRHRDATALRVYLRMIRHSYSSHLPLVRRPFVHEGRLLAARPQQQRFRCRCSRTLISLKHVHLWRGGVPNRKHQLLVQLDRPRPSRSAAPSGSRRSLSQLSFEVLPRRELGMLCGRLHRVRRDLDREASAFRNKAVFRFKAVIISSQRPLNNNTPPRAQVQVPDASLSVAVAHRDRRFISRTTGTRGTTAVAIQIVAN